NIYYLTGQQTPGYYTFQALVLPAEGEPAFVVRQLEYFNFIANTFIANAEIYQDGDQPVNFLVNVIKARGWAAKRIAIDKRGWFLPIATYEALQDKLGAIHDGAGIIEQLRIVKSPAEIEKIAIAASYVEAGMRAGLDAVRLARRDAASGGRYGENMPGGASGGARCDPSRCGMRGAACHLPASDRPRRLYRQLQKARRLQHRYCLCSRLGRGRHPQPLY